MTEVLLEVTTEAPVDLVTEETVVTVEVVEEPAVEIVIEEADGVLTVTELAPVEEITLEVEPVLTVIEVEPDAETIEIEVPGPAGPIGPIGPKGDSGDKHHAHTQSDPDDVWEWEHGLNKYPNVITFRTDGALITGDVSYPSLNHARVEFSAPTSGVAYSN